MWGFIQDEIFGMKWLNRLIGSLLNVCGLDTGSKLGGSLQFFLYDTIKILALLCILIFIITYIQSYFHPERVKKILGRFQGIGANCIAEAISPQHSNKSIITNTPLSEKFKRNPTNKFYRFVISRFARFVNG